jgi:hypothetical protein
MLISFTTMTTVTVIIVLKKKVQDKNLFSYKEIAISVYYLGYYIKVRVITVLLTYLCDKIWNFLFKTFIDWFVFLHNQGLAILVTPHTIPSSIPW